MIDRFLAYDKLSENVETLFELMELKSVVTDPVDALDSESQMPALTLQQGVDEMGTLSNRTALGYPAKRELQIIVDYFEKIGRKIHGQEVTLIEKINKIRSTVLQEGAYGPFEKDGCKVSIREKKIKGPFPIAFKNHIGIRLTFSLEYTDGGF